MIPLGDELDLLYVVLLLAAALYLGPVAARFLVRVSLAERENRTLPIALSFGAGVGALAACIAAGAVTGMYLDQVREALGIQGFGVGPATFYRPPPAWRALTLAIAVVVHNAAALLVWALAYRLFGMKKPTDPRRSA